MDKSLRSFQEEDNYMKNITEYDERQLKLIYENLVSFEKKQIGLSSLVGSLEFLLNALESIDEEWEERFLKEVTTLETANALAIIKDSEEAPEIELNKKEMLINKSIESLKKLVENKLIK
jgi:hypothetical protein